MRAVLLALGSMTAQGPLLFWVACHRHHHATSDGGGDPHSPVARGHGAWARLRALGWAHMGWMLDHRPEPWDVYVRDLLRDRLAFRIHLAYPALVLAGLLLPGLLAGAATGSWPRALAGVLWGGFVRLFLVHHASWSVNSICHAFGSRPFETGDQSRNHALTALLVFGEGWHNNHHAFPRSARHGLQWWQLDVSWLAIRALAALSLARDVQTPSLEQMARARRTA